MACNTSEIINIKQLPETYNIESVDLFSISGEVGISVVSFENMVFDIEQMAFEEGFDKHTTDIRELSGEVVTIYNNLSSIVDQEVAKMEELASEVDRVVGELECSAVEFLTGGGVPTIPSYC